MIPTPGSEAQQRRDQSPWGMGTNIRRVLWMWVRATLFRCSFHNWYAWRRMLLRMFGAQIGQDVRVRPSAWIEMPWNLKIADRAIIGDFAILYSLGTITIGEGSIISQYAHLCAGTHDHTKRSFPLICQPITIGNEVWIAADAFIGPGVTIGDRSVVGARSSVFKDVPPDVIVAGSPAKVLKPRTLEDG